MLIPTKHENLRLNVLVLGAEMLKLLRGGDQWESVESLFDNLTERVPASLDQYYDAVLFLWLAGLVKKDGYFIARIAP